MKFVSLICTMRDKTAPRFARPGPGMFHRAVFRALSRLTLSVAILVAVSVPILSFGAQPVRVVGTGGRIAGGAFAVTGSATSFWQRTPHKLGGPVTEIQVGYMNWVHSTTAEVANTNAITIEHAWIERAATGQVVPLTFSGSRQMVMPANDPAAFHLTDPVPSTVWTGTVPARDELFWVHAKGNIPAAGKIFQGTYVTFSGARFIVYDPANDPGTIDFAGRLSPAKTSAPPRYPCCSSVVIPAPGTSRSSE